MSKETKLSAAELAEIIVAGMQEKRGQDIISINLNEVSGASTNYFVICHGQSDRQAEAIAKSVEEYVFEKTGVWPYHSEGYENKEWILLDYFDVVAHIFIEQKRQFFAIEELWADAPMESYQTIN